MTDERRYVQSSRILRSHIHWTRNFNLSQLRNCSVLGHRLKRSFIAIFAVFAIPLTAAVARFPISVLVAIVLQECQSIGKPVTTAKRHNMQCCYSLDVALEINLHATKDRQCNRELAIEACDAS